MDTTTIYVLALAAIFLLVILGIKAMQAHVELVENQRDHDAGDAGKQIEGVIGGFFKGFGL